MQEIDVEGLTGVARIRQYSEEKRHARDEVEPVENEADAALAILKGGAPVRPASGIRL